MQRRAYLAMTASTLPLAGCSDVADSNDEPEDGVEDTSNPEQEEDTSNPEQEENIQAPIEPKEFSGSGTEVIQDVELGEGLAIAEVDYESEDDASRIIVKLVDTEGDAERIVYQDRHGKSGRGANVVGEGSYHIEVEADGAWSITVSQPRVTEEEAETPPLEANGTKSDIIGPHCFNGRYITEVTHTGELDIIVTVWPMEGPWGDFEMPILEDGEGTFESTFSFDGIAWIDVQADGDWTLSVE